MNKIKLSRAMILVFAFILDGCAIRLKERASTPPNEHSSENVLPNENREQAPRHEHASEGAKTYTKHASTTATPKVVVALLSKAENYHRQGNVDAAIATTERALRIQPRNAESWHQLARYRLRGGQAKIAQDLAKKSNTLAGKRTRLRRKNWLLISEARKKLGDVIGASEARAKADQY